MYSNNPKGCVNGRGEPRRAYPNRASAEEGAEYVLRRYSNRMEPYRCDRCGDWHLCPAERHTPSHACYACSKQAYESATAAENRARIIQSERGVRLRVYECPHYVGWHLTSRT